MKQQHKTKQDVVNSKVNALQDLKRQVEWLELNVKRNEYQHKLTGQYLESRIDIHIDLEIECAEKHLNLLPVAVQLRNDFIKSIGMSEPEYMERLNKDLQARKEQSKPPAPPSESVNPSAQLHAIADEIQAQEEDKNLAEVQGYDPETAPRGEPPTEPEPAIEPINVVSGDTPAKQFNETMKQDLETIPEPTEEIPVIPMTELGVKESDIF